MVVQLLRHCATSLKAVSLKPNEVIGFFNLPNPCSHIDPGVYSASDRLSTRSRKIMFVRSRARLVRGAPSVS
jgi:hypothetical protein